MADTDEKGTQQVAPATTTPAQQQDTTPAKTKKAAQTEPEPKGIDETTPGGRYIVGDKIVDATGKVLGDA